MGRENMTANPRHILFVMLAIGSLLAAWSHGLVWMAAGGNLFNLPSFFIDSFNSGPAAAFLTIDIVVAWAVFMIWVVGDAAKIGLGARTGWLFVALSFLGTCFAFPLYLVLRERHLDGVGKTA
jgi:Terpene cyclase DEP1